jgi:hypothetical protein
MAPFDSKPSLAFVILTKTHGAESSIPLIRHFHKETRCVRVSLFMHADQIVRNSASRPKQSF